MDDDNNTANAIAAVFDLVKYSNTNVSTDNTKHFAEAMYEICQQFVTETTGPEAGGQKASLLSKQ